MTRADFTSMRIIGDPRYFAARLQSRGDLIEKRVNLYRGYQSFVKCNLRLKYWAQSPPGIASRRAPRSHEGRPVSSLTWRLHHAGVGVLSHDRRNRCLQFRSRRLHLFLCVAVLVAILVETFRFSELLIDPRRKIVFMAAFLAAVFVTGYFFTPAC